LKSHGSVASISGTSFSCCNTPGRISGASFLHLSYGPRIGNGSVTVSLLPYPTVINADNSQLDVLVIRYMWLER